MEAEHGSRVAEDDVGAGAAKDLVGTKSALDDVAAVAAQDYVVACASVDVIDVAAGNCYRSEEAVVGVVPHFAAGQRLGLQLGFADDLRDANERLLRGRRVFEPHKVASENPVGDKGRTCVHQLRGVAARGGSGIPDVAELATIAEDQVVAFQAHDVVGAAEAEDDVVVTTAHEHIGAGGADDDVIAPAAGHRIASLRVRRVLRIVQGVRLQQFNVGESLEHNAIVEEYSTAAAEDQIRPHRMAAVDRVFAAAAKQDVLARPAVDQVAGVARIDETASYGVRQLAVVAEHQVIAVAAVDRVFARAAVDQVRTAAADDRVVAYSATNRRKLVVDSSGGVRQDHSVIADSQADVEQHVPGSKST